MTTSHRTADGLEELSILLEDDGGRDHVGRKVVQSRSRSSRRSPTWSPWQPRSMRSLLVYTVDSPEWDWLRAHGFRRPSPPSKSGPSRQRADRDGVTVEARLTPEAATALTQLVPEHYESRTAAVNAALVALAASVK